MTSRYQWPRPKALTSKVEQRHRDAWASEPTTYVSPQEYARLTGEPQFNGHHVLLPALPNSLVLRMADGSTVTVNGDVNLTPTWTSEQLRTRTA